MRRWTAKRYLAGVHHHQLRVFEGRYLSRCHFRDLGAVSRPHGLAVSSILLDATTRQARRDAPNSCRIPSPAFSVAPNRRACARTRAPPPPMSVQFISLESHRLATVFTAAGLLAETARRWLRSAECPRIHARTRAREKRHLRAHRAGTATIELPPSRSRTRETTHHRDCPAPRSDPA
jgi:hypothetical protein